MAPIRVLFVQDGEATGSVAAAAIGADPAIELVARARDPQAAAEMLQTEAPDVVVIYAGGPPHPMRETLAGAARVQGAGLMVVDAAANEPFDSLRKRVKETAARRARRPGRRAPSGPVAGRSTAKLIAIGASTGGVEALVQLLSAFPKTCPPTVIVQHMPPFFTTSFANRLDSVCAPKVHEAWDGAPLQTGVMYLAPGGAAHLEVAWSPNRKVRLVETPPVNRHRPAVDVTFHSVARQLGKAAIGVLLTGMGRDGADGLKAMREAGAQTIAQDKETSTVYGMPRAALENGAVDKGTPLNLIAKAIFSPESAQKETLEWP
jgi:two-component system chemotaxis response regulator CheB